MFKVMVYGHQCGIYSSRKLEEACRYRVDFMWLLEEENAPDHATTARFRTGRCASARGLHREDLRSSLCHALHGKNYYKLSKPI